MRRRRRAARAVWILAAAALLGIAGLVWWLRGPSSEQKVAGVFTPTNAASAQSSGRTASASQTTPIAERSFPESKTAAATNRNPVATEPLVASKTAIASAAIGFPRPIENVFELQVALARQGISSGSIDGLIGPQTRTALQSFQRREHLTATGQLDNPTRAALVLDDAPTAEYQVTSNDMSRLQPLSPTWLGKSRQTALEYETLLELVSEKAQAHPALLRQLNPDLDWGKVAPGTAVVVPKVSSPPPNRRAAYLTIQLAEKTLEAWDSSSNLLAHFPCSIGRLVEKRPVGELHVASIALNPNYTFDPENFPESAEARELGTRLILPPGPNNPVGTAWIGLDKPGYGIHGTPRPEQVGRTESHGCFRLANWNAEYLARLVVIGTPVYVQP